LKPAITGLDDHDLNEHICLRAAQSAGLLSARTAIKIFEDQSAVVTERYDRVPAVTDWVRRIHQEDLCQATSHTPQQKYQNEGGPTPSEIVGLFRRVLEGPEVEIAVWRFLDALTLNWLIGGTDAHSKNYSLLLERNQVRLAPLYDVASALPYDLPIQKLRLAMKFGASYLLTPRDSKMWPAVAKELGLAHSAVVERVASLMDRLPDAFADAVRDPAVQAIGSALPRRLVDRVTDRIAAARLTLP
jgi:serine/threonine-protein kinase HipA